MSRPFIVAEVSKTWTDGLSPTPHVLGQLFEEVITVNWARGYRLHSWQLHRLMVRKDELRETIVAVFEHEEEGAPAELETLIERASTVWSGAGLREACRRDILEAYELGRRTR